MRVSQWIVATMAGAILILLGSLQAAGQMFPPVQPGGYTPSLPEAKPEVKPERTITGHVLQITDLIGMQVRDQAQVKLGKIENLAIDQDTGKISYAVVSFGETLGFGGKLLPVPWQALKIVSPTKPGETVRLSTAHCVLNVDKDLLAAKAPSFEKGEWPDFKDQKLVAAIEQFYRPFVAKRNVETPAR